MKLLDHYDGSELPFEGDLTLTLRSLPQGARINSAKIRLTPVDASGGTDPFTESIAFTGNSGTWNATKAANADWVEVDFHDRRTLVSVQGSHLTNSTLQIDLGGAYVEINDKGAIKTPGDNDFLVNGNGSLLPGLTVNKFKLTSASASPDIHTVIVRSAPANVQLRLADLAPAWSYVGDMTTAQTTPDLAEVLQATLADLELDNSYYILPISLHSDTIARFQVTVEIDYVLETALLPADLSEVTLPYAYNTIANSEEGLLQVALPANAKVLPRDTAAKVIGAFEDTRIVYGALGTVSAQGEALISPALTQAQPLALDKPLAATAVDLLLASVTRTARLRLDVREDLDGKPAGASLLTGNVEVHLDRESASQATWTSVDLPREFQFKAQNEMQYWVVIQSLEGEAVWSVSPISPGGLGMQSTDNGGLSWRLSQVRSIGGAITGRLRLRRVPERYQVPVELSIGEGDQAQRVKLDRFQPLGRVDFELNIPEMADAFNNYLRQASAAACFEAEHIADGEFNQWLRSGTELADTTTTIPLTFEPTRVAVTPDGSAAYVATLESLVSTSIGTTHLEKIVTTSNTARTLDVQAPGSAIALNFSPNGDRLYLLTATAESALTIIDTNDDHLIRTTDLGALGVSDMAVNPDGSRLYVAQYSKNFGSIRPYDTSQFTAVAADIVIGAGLAPLAVTVSAMGTARTFLYVLVNEVTLQGHNIYGQNLLYRYDTDRHMLAGAPLRLGRGGGDLTIASCGQLAIVSNVDDNSLNVVDLEQWKVIGSAIDVNAEVEGVVLSPDCARAYGYYIGESASFITAADTRQRRKIHEKDITGFIRDIAIGPNGDQLYVAVHDNSLAIIATAPSAPLEWTVAAGRATHLCYPSPFGNVAVLGVSELNTDPVPTGLAQTIPITSDCTQPYRFSFWGAATDLQAVAEIHWIDQQCARIRTETLPIHRPASRETEGNVNIDAYPIPTAAELILHSLDLTPPAGATQAEVRFRVPFGIAVIDAVSMKVTAATTRNNELRLNTQGQPFYWAQTPEPTLDEPAALLITVADKGIRLRNMSAELVTLLQTVPVTAGQTFQFELLGRINEVFTEESLPQAGVRWQSSEGVNIEPAVSLDISPNQFERYAATGNIPAQAVQAEVFIALPPQTSVDIQIIALRTTAPTNTAVAFLSHAPGELTLSQAQVVYDIGKAAPVEIPATGLCKPAIETPPPGTVADECGYCGSCQSITGVCEPHPAVTPAGRPAVVGTCRSCGSKSVILGGPLFPTAAPVTRLIRPAPSLTSPPSVQLSPPSHKPTPLSPVSTASDQIAKPPSDDLTQIKGIGAARADKLAIAHISSFKQLAELQPADIKRILPGVSTSQTTEIAEAAKALWLKNSTEY